MKSQIITKEGSKGKTIDFPEQFNEVYHPDLIKRAVHALQATARSIYGAYIRAGKRPSAELSRRRRKYRGSYGFGISRVPRKILSRRGTRFNWVGAFAPGTVSGRRAHPPKAERIFTVKINKKERKKAIRSAFGATLDPVLLKQRNHSFNEYPLVVDSSVEKLSKTKDVKKFLFKLGLEKEIERISETKIRAGKGKLRGRKKRKKVGPLIVTSSECPLSKSAINIQGVNVIPVNAINTEHLAPGAVAGRLTIYTEAALDKMGKERLFY